MEDLKRNIIELQETYNISLFPLKQITKDQNNKKVYQDPNILKDFWKNADIRFSTDYLINQLKIIIYEVLLLLQVILIILLLLTMTIKKHQIKIV